MKSAFILVISSFFLIGAFGESVSVSVMEGDSVTLHTNLTEIQRTDTVEWRFNGERIAKISRNSNGAISAQVSTDGPFRGRLQLNNQTGDLKITAFSNTDSGQYTLKIKSTRGSPEKTFSVNGVLNADKDPVKKVLGTVGESVTLKTEKQSDEVMKWRFGPQNTLIAELKVSADRFTVYDDVLDGRFRGRLELDDQTGSLNITDITTEHDGVYKAEIRGSGYTILKTFNVTVTDVKSMSVMEGDSVTLHTGLTHIQRNDVILWRFGDKGIIAHLNGPGVKSGWSNFQLSVGTGDLTISNIQRNQRGDYKVWFNTTNMISQRKYNIIISETVTVFVMEGDSVTLHTASEIPRDNAVLWFGDKSARIILSPGSVDARWKNTDQNNQTGDLTIKNIRRDQSGDYRVIFMNIQTLFVRMHRKFHINITGVNADPVKKVLGTVGGFVTLKTEKQSDEVMKWRFGSQNTVIAELKEPADSFTVYDDVLDGRFRDRLELDNQTGSLTITDIRTTDSGVYEAGIRGNRSGYTIHETFSVTVRERDQFGDYKVEINTINMILHKKYNISDSGLSTGAIVGIVIVVVAVLLVFAAVRVIYSRKCSKTETHSEVNGQNHTSNKDEETELTKPAEAAE